MTKKPYLNARPYKEAIAIYERNQQAAEDRRWLWIRLSCAGFFFIVYIVVLISL